MPQCLTPQNVWHGKELKVNGEMSGTYSCGYCVNCRKKKSLEWVFRLSEELKVSNAASFITLTYSEENVPLTGDLRGSLYPDDLKNFWKRLRKRKYKREPKKPIKYYACGEYGTNTQRPHYHAIVFNHPTWTANNLVMEKIWKLGRVDVQPVNTATIAYVTGYTIKGRLTEEELGQRMPEFARMSQNLGLNFLTHDMKQYIQQKNEPTVQFKGRWINLPRYYKRKVWQLNEEELNRVDMELENKKYRKRLDQQKQMEAMAKPLEFCTPHLYLSYLEAVNYSEKKRQNEKRKHI